jgi:hypothetical protein
LKGENDEWHSARDVDYLCRDIGAKKSKKEESKLVCHSYKPLMK